MKLKAQDFKKFADALGTKIGTITDSGYAMFSCPLAPWTHAKGRDTSPSMSMKHNGHCNCFACGFHGDPEDLAYTIRAKSGGDHPGVDLGKLMELWGRAQDDALFDLGDAGDYDDKPEDLIVFPEWWLDTFPSALRNPVARAYLEGRSGGPVPETVTRALDLRYDPYRQRVCFPIRDAEERLIGFHGRDVTGNNDVPYLRYKLNHRANGGLLLGEEWCDVDRPLLVTEGPFDLARAVQCYRNTCCPLMARFEKKALDKIGQACVIYTLFDGDEAGDLARDKVQSIATKKRVVRHLRVPGQKDPGATPAGQLADFLSDYLELDPLVLA